MMSSNIMFRRTVLTTTRPLLTSASSLDSSSFRQQRWMGGRRKKNKGGGNVHVPRIKMMPCWKPGDLENKEGDWFTSKLEARDVQKWMEVGSHQKLEFHDGEAWVPFGSLKERWRALDQPIPIRVPEFYDAKPYDQDNDVYDYDEEEDEEDPDEDDVDDGPESTSQMQIILMELTQTLIKEGYSRSEQPGMLHKKNGESISAKDWALDQPKLHSAILGTPGSLNHIVTCLDYPFYWDMVADLEERLGEGN